jgi:site-specific recombinase XerD
MQNPTTGGLSLSVFESQYDAYLLAVRGLSRSTRSLHRHVVHKLFSSRFPIGYITWSEIRFSDFVQFLTSEFARLHNRWTRTTWLMVLRSLLRYLSREGYLPSGWDAALPAVATRKQISLPRGVVTENSVRAGNAKILSACRHSLPEKLIEGTIQ